MKPTVKLAEKISTTVQRRTKDGAAFGLDGTFEVVCHDANGVEKWREVIENIVTNVGLDHALDATLSAGTQITTWYLGLTDGTPTVAATDTAASHVGWVEVTAYSEAVRQTFTASTPASQSVDNVGNEAVFTANGTTTVGGAFLISDNTKGGSTGTLFSAGAFTGGDRSLVNLDTLTVTYTVDASDA